MRVRFFPFVLNWFLDKTFMVVQGDLETTMSYMKKGLIVQNDQYMPVQKSLDMIAKSIKKVEGSLEEIKQIKEVKEN